MRTRDHDAIVSKFDAFRVDPRKLRIKEGFNARDLTTPEAIEKLALLKEQVRENGVLVPLEVRRDGDELYITSGHRRHKVCMELIAEGHDIRTVPAVTEPAGTSEAQRILNLALYNANEPLTMLELAENVVRPLLNLGWSRDEIQNKLGYKTPQMIANFELLLAAPEALKQAIKQGELAASTAVELVRREGDSAATKLPALRETARQRGKGRVSMRDVQQQRQPRGGATAYEVEQRNRKALADFAAQQKKDIEAVEDAVEILTDLSKRGVRPATMAEEIKHCENAKRAADWLLEFCDALRHRHQPAADSAEQNSSIIH